MSCTNRDLLAFDMFCFIGYGTGTGISENSNIFFTLTVPHLVPAVTRFPVLPFAHVSLSFSPPEIKMSEDQCISYIAIPKSGFS